MAAEFDAAWTYMPTLIRLLVFLIVLAGLGFGGIIALTVMVDPGEKDITIKIPARDLTPASQAIDLSNLPAPVNVVHDDSSASGAPASAASAAAPAVPAASDEPSIDTTDSAASAPGVKTVDTGAD